MNTNEGNLLSIIAGNLEVSPADLFKLIQFESKWDPLAKNPRSSAKGLIQFTNATAKSLGFNDSLDLITKNPTITDQLPIVEKYLAKFKPFGTKQSLYMSVFYPVARTWNENAEFPAVVQKSNPGIKTVKDYVRKVEGTLVAETTIIPIVGGMILLYVILNRKGK